VTTEDVNVQLFGFFGGLSPPDSGTETVREKPSLFRNSHNEKKRSCNLSGKSGEKNQNGLIFVFTGMGLFAIGHLPTTQDRIERFMPR
jgi:hypothetical protein